MSKPNILWIYCDELRTDALGCYGGGEVPMRTPHIDSLAERGVLFENCFCNSPVCVPSRTATLTARYPEQTGVYHNEGTWTGFELPIDRPLTFPEVFAAAGYATANFGKTHVNAAIQPWQTSDPSGAGMGDLLSAVGRDSDSLIMPRGVGTYLGGQWPEGVAYPHDVVAKNAANWMGAQGGRPFLARVSLLEPHTPVFPPQPFDTLYDARAFSGEQPARENVSEFENRFAAILDASNFSPAMVQQAKAYYYGLVGWVDSQVGKLLGELDRLGLRENTVVVFEADHGASLGEGGCWAKHIFAPQSHRVPRIVSYPSAVGSGERRSDICESLDLARTLLGLCAIEPAAEFMGRDLFNDQPPEAVYSTIGFGHAKSRAFPNKGDGEFAESMGWPRRSCVRTAQYRLDKNTVINSEDASEHQADTFLADVVNDPEEQRNLVNENSYQNVYLHLSELLDIHSDRSVEAAVDRAYAARKK